MVLSADALGQLHVLWHDGDSLSVDGAQVAVLEQRHHVRFGRFLQCRDGRSLESQIALVLSGDLTDQSLEWQFAEQQFRRLLVSADFSQRHGSRSETVWLLHSAGGWCRFAGGFGRQLLSRRLSSGRLSCGLLGAGHFEWFGFLIPFEIEKE